MRFVSRFGVASVVCSVVASGVVVSSVLVITCSPTLSNLLRSNPSLLSLPLLALTRWALEYPLAVTNVALVSVLLSIL